ncbi:MBL fold metallo-hydrolase [Clostridium rectalis]|uniref:MBL fold metallo-hydrolase n=1 Tax=Clostridium rectalis TaxID=2040295 RepID=UPI000F63F28B|nr:MBL fold metallo-hydrolase [Clostridium rectalis]
MDKFHIKRLSDNILYLPADHETDRPILAAIYGKKSTLIVDCGNSSNHAELFLNQLKEYDLPPIKFATLTHWHWDHIFGMEKMNVPIISHIKTKEAIEKMIYYKWDDEELDKRVKEGIEIPFCADMIKKEFKNCREDIKIILPDITFEDKLEIDLGDINCCIENVGGDHSEDSTVVFVKESKTVFLGDALAAQLYAPNWYYSKEGLKNLLKKIQEYDANMYVESHCSPVGRNEFNEYINKLRKYSCIAYKNGYNLDKSCKELKEMYPLEVGIEDIELMEYFVNEKYIK